MSKEELKPITTRIPKDLHKKLKIYATQQEISLQEAIIQAIRELLKKG